MADKWKIRKENGVWNVYRPVDRTSILTFETFAELLKYGPPDCPQFVHGYCFCRYECAR
jgi:hypothetical protein